MTRLGAGGFGSSLAKVSLGTVAPARWDITFRPMPLGIDPNGTVNAGLAAQTKDLRQYLNEPVITNPATGGTITLSHPPLYRKLTSTRKTGSFVDLTSRWEKGIEPITALSMMVLDQDEVDRRRLS